MGSEMGRSRWGEALMVSLASRGHMTPMMHVAKELMERGISITVVIPEDERELVDKALVAEYMEARGLMSFELVRSLSKLEEEDAGLVGLSTNLERACETLFQNLLVDQESGVVQAPKCIVADQFLGWTQVWATKLRIPRYVSFTSPAAYAMTMLCHGSLEDQLEHAPDKEDPDFVTKIPTLELDLHLTDLPKSFLKHDDSFRMKVVDKSGDSFKDAAGILVNTFYELESEVIDGFQAHIETLGTNPAGKVTKMLPIGPMLPPAFFEEDVFGEKAQKSKCLRWLDTRRPSSVLYIAFGSWAFLSPPQIQELAHGLEASQVSFMWILRLEEGAGDVAQLLPPGFCDRTQDRGFVHSEFAPQLQILSHPATAGFLTHCGWNSSLESICRGVPMLGWPMHAEQGICCRILVDLAQVATEIQQGRDNSVSREDIQRAINVLMKEPKGQELKRRAVELQHLARTAVSPGGSSHRSLEEFAKDLQEQQ